MKIDRDKCLFYSNFKRNHKEIEEITSKYNFILLPKEITEMLIYEKKILVRYEIYKKKDLIGSEIYRNIWCYSTEGELLWRIQATATHKTFSGVLIEKDTDLLKACTGFGLVFDLDIETGEISNPDFRK